MKKVFETEEKQENCILIVVCSKKSDNKKRKEEEIKRLAESAGLNVVGSFSQNIKEFNRSTIIGSGKLEEIKGAISEISVDVVIVDYALAGSQMKNISNALGARVVDRVGLIIDIFARGAQTAEAKLQVKYAQDKYLLPRLSEMQGSSGRFGSAGVGMRGPGETKLELNRRVLESEMANLKKQIDKIKLQRSVTKRDRQKNNIPIIAIVGYTNAGKSSLLNILTKENIYADDRLFATLDTTSRKLYLGEGRQAILIDTVGFISDLPHELVDAFSATLESAVEADLILHVVDASLNKKLDGKEEYLFDMEVTEKVLDDLHATKNRLVVFNKADKLTSPLLLKQGQVIISTKTGAGIKNLLNVISENLFE